MRSALLILALLAASAALAESKLLGTSGGQQIEGQAGGGLVPWAVLAGYGDVGEWGVSAALSQVRLDDFQLDVAGIAVSYNNRLELSAARQRLQVQPLNSEIRQDIVSAKLRLAGDLIYGSTPAITAGLQWKHNLDMAIPQALGASDDKGVDIILSASKLFLGAIADRNLLVNLGARHSEANQTGLLGFGSASQDGAKLLLEGSAGIFLNRHWVVGIEYRQKPDRLVGVREDAWAETFVGWFPNKKLSVVAAYTDLGSIAGLADQRGVYLSLQITR